VRRRYLPGRGQRPGQRLPPAGPPEAHAEVLCRRRRRRHND
jgi:hypothetical protein